MHVLQVQERAGPAGEVPGPVQVQRLWMRVLLPGLPEERLAAAQGVMLSLRACLLDAQ
jgi:hypothetical protein